MKEAEKLLAEINEAPRADQLFYGLEAAAALTPAQSKRFERSGTGPFLETMRIACPLKAFRRRKTGHCLDCKFYRGVAVKPAVGALDPENPETARRSYTILCGCPLSRTPEICPED